MWAFSFLGHLTSAQIVTLEVKEGNSTCIKAELVARFSVAYNSTNGTVSLHIHFCPLSAVIHSHVQWYLGS